MNSERAGSLFWLAVGLISIYGSIHLGLGTLREPGSGFLSFLAGCFISLMAGGVFLQTLLRGQEAPLKLTALWEGLRWRRPLAIGLILTGYILILERIGFLVTSLVILLILFKGVEKFSWGKAIFISVIVSLAVFFLFHNVLKATLPRGIWGF